MHRNVGRWVALWECDCPRQRAWMSIVVADEETSDSPNGMSDGKTRGRGGQHSNDWQLPDPHQRDARADSARKPAEPAHSTAAENKIAKRLLAEVLSHPQQLRARDPADQPR